MTTRRLVPLPGHVAVQRVHSRCLQVLQCILDPIATSRTRNPHRVAGLPFSFLPIFRDPARAAAAYRESVTPVLLNTTEPFRKLGAPCCTRCAALPDHE